MFRGNYHHWERIVNCLDSFCSLAGGVLLLAVSLQGVAMAQLLSETESLRSGAADSGATQLTESQRQVCDELGLDPAHIAQLADRPLFEFDEADVDAYLKFLSRTNPELPRRVVQLARKNIGQPYELYLLGEMPFETYDPQPLYCLSKSDCLVFAEHTYAMALADDWPSFFRYLQRIRYRDGQIGVASRNHFTESDWNPSNRWLVRDITLEIANGQEVEFRQKVDRAAFLKKRYQLIRDIPVESHVDQYIPLAAMESALPHLQDGDFVNVVRGYEFRVNETFNGSAWVGHVGLVARASTSAAQDAKSAVHFIHATKPQVREEPILDYIARSKENASEGKPQLLGFKFLRLESHPQAKLRELDGPDAPHVRVP